MITSKAVLFLIAFNFVSLSQIYSQENLYNRIKQEYELFEYAKVIELSNNFFVQEGIPDSLKIDVYLMRSISFYSLGKEDSTKNNFNEILKINNNYNADPSKVSPKLITIFNSVKSEFLKTHKDPVEQDDSTTVQQKINYGVNPSYKYSLLQNFILPGWGNINRGYLTKGIITSIISTANLAAMIYYINDTNKKENEYLSETNKNLLQQKYNSFDSSYKTRNILIVTYVLVWVYSQLDYLFFSSNSSPDTPTLSNNRIIFEGNGNKVNLGYKFPLKFFYNE